MIYFKCPNVLWNTVGIEGEESLLIKEGKEVDMFIISGKLGSAIWSRLDGMRTVGDLALEVASHFEMDRDEILDVVAAFIKSLEEHELIQTEPIKSPQAGTTVMIDWPVTMEAPTLSHFDIQSLVSEDMVAFASFAGGRDNIGGGGSCQVGIGGKNNIDGAQPVCHR